MLRPMTKAKASRGFVTVDIENRSDGSMIAGDVFDGFEHFTFSNWSEFLQLLAANDWHTLYAHNGGGWDYLSLVEHLLRARGASLSAMLSGSTVIGFLGSFEGRSIRMLDSLRLFFASLEKVGKAFSPETPKLKVEVLPEELWNTDRLKFWEYLRRDTETLYHSLIRFQGIVNEIAPIGELGMTLASTAMKVFRRKYLFEPIAIPTGDKLRAFLRLGYRGGRVECFKKGYCPFLRVYDVNSLYPYCMSVEPVPTTNRGVWSTKFDGRTGMYRVKFTKNPKIPVPLIQGDPKISVLSSPELRYALELGYEFKVLQGYVFESESVLFGQYSRDLYRLRMSDKNSPMGEACKLLMNSLYGKFGESPEKKALVCYSSFDELCKLCWEGEIEIIDESKGIAIQTIEKQSANEHVGIAATITSAARVQLHKAILSSTGKVWYCDTDSIHTEGTCPNVGNELGKLKLEFEGEGAYAGRKLYALRSSELEKIRAKGIRVKKNAKDELGCALEFESLKRVASGARILCQFRSATTLREVIQGKKACTFLNRTRTIRRT
jgi:hypothetical protein